MSRHTKLPKDVEGAEWFVLNRAKTILKTHSPDVLLSAHDSCLHNYGRSKRDVTNLLTDHGYGVEVLGVDHEEYWLCGRV